VDERCATSSRASGEDACGTASRARRWVLVEQPGSWGPDALTTSGLPAEVGAYLRTIARALPARVLLLRRTGGRAARGAASTVFVGRSLAQGGWLERIDLDHLHDLTDLDLSPLSEGRSVGGTPVVEPLYLVCTNGKHDPCCAEHGLPVARALAGLVGERAWECSHVGGDRFAANLVCLPDGVMYGHLDPATAARAVAAHERGQLLLERFRGRSSLAFATQAAEGLTRRRLGLDRLDALRAVRSDRDGDVVRVTLALADGTRLVATVQVGRQQEATPLTCGGVPGRAPTYRLVDLTAAPAP
jgi:hypothetical protein